MLGGGESDKHLIYEGLSRVDADAVMAGATTARSERIVFSIWHPELVALRRARVWSLYPYLVVGGFVWLATELSGVHATIAGVALGLANLCLKRLARKGYIKITTIPSHRIKYLLTPKGMAEKSRLTYAYMQYSLNYYREMRERLKQVLTELSQAGAKRIVIYGTGELAELAYLTLREMDLTLVGFVDGGGEGQMFLSYPLWPVEALSGWSYDAVMIADLADVKKIQARLVRAGVPKDKIVALANDIATIKRLLENHLKYTGSDVAKRILGDFDNELRWFVKVMPTDYRMVLEHQAEIEERAKKLGQRQTPGR